jgi:primosomal protein N' (replication factor Y)
MCHECGWRASCDNCDSLLTLHRQPHHLRCHHCDYQRKPEQSCPVCHNPNLIHLGAGTEKVEQMLADRFKNCPVIRIDRDSTRRKNALATLLEPVSRGDPCILVGTQMLAKGHHYPKITLVLVVDADGGLFTTDFRAAERTGQLLIQVAGRAGRGDQPGKVLIQTHHPDHPFFADLFERDYRAFAHRIASERQAGQMPPFIFMALIRAEAPNAGDAEAFLRTIKHQLGSDTHEEKVDILGPLPAIIERVNRRYRQFLQIKCHRRVNLHKALTKAEEAAMGMRAPKGLRWSIDVDPQEMP